MRSPRSRTNVLVVDASVIAPAVADGGPDGEACRAQIKGQSLAAPDLLRVEAVSVIRRQLGHGALTATQATNAIEDLLNLPISRLPDSSTTAACMGAARQHHRVRRVLRRARRSAGLRPRHSRPTTRQRSRDPLPVRHRVEPRTAARRTSTQYRAIGSLVTGADAPPGVQSPDPLLRRFPLGFGDRPSISPDGTTTRS